MPRTCQAGSPLSAETAWISPGSNNGSGALGARASYGSLGAYFTATAIDPAQSAVGGSVSAWFFDDLTISGPPGQTGQLVIPFTLAVGYNFNWGSNLGAYAGVRDGPNLAYVECRINSECRINGDPLQPLPGGIYTLGVPGTYTQSFWFNSPFTIAVSLMVFTGAGAAGTQWVNSWNSLDLTGFHVYSGTNELSGYDLTTGSGFDYRTLNAGTIPEPGTMWILAAGLLLWGARRAASRRGSPLVSP
ncbi:MAG: PEP-CTERM sorting domain-containing protein [Acidobacteria bacterium]|nr:PEP-CTERM sorting domain-containing protein [Acidobacteriota bacterium]